MATEVITKADAEFLQGNFEEARRLYSDALKELDEGKEGSPAAVATCLQKLGDTNYVLHRYEEAEMQFVQLNDLLEKTEGKAQDIANTLLKLAKTKEKLDKLDEADITFQCASDFAQQSLPAEHFILSSIFSSYSAMLQRTKRNPELAAELEKKLKDHPRTKTSESKIPKPAEENGDESAKEETPSAPARKNAAESAQENLSAMKNKLQKASKKRTTDSDGPKKKQKLREGDENPKLVVPTNPSEGGAPAVDAKSLKKEAAKKGFLKKEKGNKDKKTGDKAKQDRSRLRRAMAVVREHSQPAEQETNQLDDFAWEEHVVVDPASEAKEEKPSGLGRSFPSVSARPTGRRQIALIGKTLASARANFDAEGHLIADPDSERVSTFRVAGGQSSQHPILQEWKDSKLVETEVETRWWEDQKNVFMVLLGSSVLLIGMVFTLAFLLPDDRNAWADYATHDFCAADGHLQLSFKEKGGCEISDYATSTTASLCYFGPGWQDELKLVAGYYDSCEWALDVPEGFRIDDGITLFASSAPENRVIDSMNAFAAVAQIYYGKHHRYPQGPEDFDNYRNPFSGEREPVVFSNSIEKHEIDANSKTELELRLESGARFPNESKSKPGAIHAFSMLTNPDFSVGDRGTWDCQSLFFHCFDRNNRLVGTSEKGKTLLLLLKGGRDTTLKATPHRLLSTNNTARICLTKVPKPDRVAVIMKYVLFVIALAVAGLVLRHYGVYPFAKKESK